MNRENSVTGEIEVAREIALSITIAENNNEEIVFPQAKNACIALHLF